LLQDKTLKLFKLHVGILSYSTSQRVSYQILFVDILSW